MSEIDEAIETINMEPSYPTLLGAAGVLCEHVTELRAELAEAREGERVAAELFEAQSRDYGRLQDELDRVKAESLRVVPVGDECEITRIRICQCFKNMGTVYRLYSFSSEEFGAWAIKDHSEHLFSPDTEVLPVRLERWTP